ncbi:MAG: DEAD/DEAH box helicase [Chromatiales bacterium]|jgi:ATP-dependent RNA helicase DeaD
MTEDTKISFTDLALADAVLKAVTEIGYEQPSPIQAQCIPALLQGQDLLGQAQTGTGKTAAFALPLLSKLDLNFKQPQLLVLAPTRELAIQVAEALQTYARHLKNFHVLPVYGGQSYEIQLRQLRRGVQAVVGTPGRILDHLKRGTLDLGKLSALVLDEADEMLRMGFIDDVEEILSKTPEQRQTALFSATMPERIRKVAQKYLRNPVEVKIQTRTTTVETIKQRYWQVSGLHKLDALTRILEVEDMDAMIIFVRTKTATAELAEKLEARGYAAAALNGDMNQAMRERTIDRLKKGQLDIVIATDVAARGLDVPRISHVLNYDIPYDTEAYVHRIGRTGRAGKTGQAILFVAPRERRMLHAIEKATRQPIEEMRVPSVKVITDKRVEKFKQLITDTIEAQDLAVFEQLIGAYQQEHDIGLSEIAAALAYLAQAGKPLFPAEKGRRAAKEAVERAPRVSKVAAEQVPEAVEKKPRKKKKAEDEEVPMETFRIEVGRTHNAEPKNIVGAIANEAELESRYIGHIKLYDDYSTVDLPVGMPDETFAHLQKVWVCGRPLKISRLAPDARRFKAEKKPRKSQRKKHQA